MQDPSSRASQSFGLLDNRARKWIWDKNWTELHDIQERSIPLLLEGRKDLLIAAPTGLGKTEAAFLPICSRLAAEEDEGFGALYISPLKALINDQYERLDDLCNRLEIPIHRWHGDVGGGAKRSVIKSPRGILLITPESLEAFFVLRGPMMNFLLRNTRYVVIDELHSFIGTERGAQLRSLLHRIELAARKRIPRIGLSATLGVPRLAAEFLRFNDAEGVEILESKTSGQELKVQLRGDISESHAKDEGFSSRAEERSEIADHLFAVLRGHDNLVFANSRKAVEEYADRLRVMAETMGLPREFWPHHGNLSKSVREDVERMLKDENRPTTAVCTSTLELGIDIGAVRSVAQINAPPGVASLRQRMGRSGRRDDPAILRCYVTEKNLGSKVLPPLDAIRSRLVTTIAMMNLMIEGWCEPPADKALHGSTLVQQVLSVIAQHGGARAEELWNALCGAGPFQSFSPTLFADLLRSIGSYDLIVQTNDGTLLLGEVGERIVNHYSFYTAFTTEEEFRVIDGSQELGTMPLRFGVAVGSLIIFAGRRWRVVDVDDAAKVVQVEPAPGGIPPKFEGGELGFVHERVRREMRWIYESADVPAYLDSVARSLLSEGRKGFRALGLDRSGVVRNGNDHFLFPWSSDRAHNALTLMLKRLGLESTFEGVSINVSMCETEELMEALRIVYKGEELEAESLASTVENLQFEKYDQYLGKNILQLDFAGKRLDTSAARGAARVLLAEMS